MTNQPKPHDSFSSKPIPEFPPSRGRDCDIPSHLIILRAPGIKIRLMGPDERGPGDDLVPQIQHDEQNHTYIPDEEILGIPGDKRREPLGDDDEDIEEETVPRKERLPHRFIRQGIARDVPRRERAHESDMAAVQTGPRNEPRNGGDVQQPVEDGAATLREIQEGEEPEGGGECYGAVRHAALGGEFQEGRGGAVVREPDEDARAGVDVGVCSGEDDEEEDGVDEAREYLDSGKVGGDDEGGGGRVGG